MPAQTTLTDQFGRRIEYLRISVTDRCNFRCVYCMPLDGLPWLPKAEILTYEEITEIVRQLAPLGLRRLRITGGEPTIRPDLVTLVRMLRSVPGIEDISLSTNGVKLPDLAKSLRDAGLDRVIISSAGQLFCAVSCMTSASRMMFAFSRDRAVPGWKNWSQVSKNRVPERAVMLVAALAAAVTLPALIEVNLGTPDDPLIVPVAFYAVTSIAVIGLYLSFAIPIHLRWKHGDKFQVGEWNNGAKYRWMNPIAVAEILLVCFVLMMPFVPGGIPGNDDFAWKFVNYAPIVSLGALLGLTIWWQVSAKHWFTGPIRQVDEPSKVL